MSPTVLLTLGRLPKGLDIARALAAAGCRVLVAEPARRHLTGSSHSVQRSYTVTAPATDTPAYRREMLDIIRSEQVDLIIPVSEECLHVAALKPYLPDRARLFGPDFELTRSLHDKLDFVDELRAQNIDTPDTLLLSDPQASALVQDHACVIKGRYSCAGTGLQFIDQGTTLPDLANPERWVIQRKMQGQLISTFSITSRGRVIGTVVYEATMLSGSVAVAFKRIERPAIEDWVRTFVTSRQYSGFVSFDFIVDKDQSIWPIECNPRTTSGLHFVTGKSLAQAILEPESTFQLDFRANRKMQQFYPALTETQKSLFGRNSFRSNLAALFTSRDVTFRWSDPKPFVLMPYSAWHIMSQAMFSGQSFGAVATADIDWQPEHAE